MNEFDNYYLGVWDANYPFFCPTSVSHDSYEAYYEIEEYLVKYLSIRDK